MAKIFLTGNKRIGKSTIIADFLKIYSGKIGGFITKRVLIEKTDNAQIYIFDIRDDQKSVSSENIVGLCSTTRIIESYSDTFDTIGVKALTFEEMPDLIVMDELGIMEKDAHDFQARVLSLLEQKVNILGVVKNKNTAFLEAVRQHDETTVLTVDGTNQKEILDKIKKMIQ